MNRLSLPIEHLTPAAFAPYGAVWGRPYGTDTPAYSNSATDFWHQHFFDTGENGKPEVLWVNYRKNDRVIETLEVHWLTQQAIVPLGPDGIIHVVALNDPASGRPDPASMKAFRVPMGQGICMSPGCWHATQVTNQQVSCLMLTRDSTTAELVRHLQHAAKAIESELVPLDHTYVLGA